MHSIARDKGSVIFPFIDKWKFGGRRGGNLSCGVYGQKMDYLNVTYSQKIQFKKPREGYKYLYIKRIKDQ